MKFDELIEESYNTILEQDIPPMQQAAAAPIPPAVDGVAPGGPLGGDMGGGIGGDPSMGGGEPEGKDPADMENETKRNADPREYTRSILSLLVDDNEGVSPEMFDDFVDSVSLAITKVKDKPGLKRFYSEFYTKLSEVLSLREELKSMFKQLHGTMQDLVGAQEEPNDAGGGVGQAGPSGPGVR